MIHFGIVSSGTGCLYCKCNQKAKTLTMQIAGVNLGQKEAESCCGKVKL